MDFEKQVIENSSDKPVIVDFWAPWCGPCRFLGPIIQELANEAGSKWELVKVNTDENQDISRKYRIQGIPAVKMFYKGEVIAEFTGALPRHQIEKWLEENLPDERKKELAAILERLKSGDTEMIQELESFTEKYPELSEGRVELARFLALKDPDKAAELVEDIKPGNPYFPLVEDIFAIKALANCKMDSIGNPAEKIEQGKKSIVEGSLDTALEALIDAVVIDKMYCNELPRKSVIAVFNLLGRDHPLTKKYRKRFDMALY